MPAQDTGSLGQAVIQAQNAVAVARQQLQTAIAGGAGAYAIRVKEHFLREAERVLRSALDAERAAKGSQRGMGGAGGYFGTLIPPLTVETGAPGEPVYGTVVTPEMISQGLANRQAALAGQGQLSNTGLGSLLANMFSFLAPTRRAAAEPSTRPAMPVVSTPTPTTTPVVRLTGATQPKPYGGSAQPAGLKPPPVPVIKKKTVLPRKQTSIIRRYTPPGAY